MRVPQWPLPNANESGQALIRALLESQERLDSIYEKMKALSHKRHAIVGWFTFWQRVRILFGQRIVIFVESDPGNYEPWINYPGIGKRGILKNPKPWSVW
jgi:hypothetical protein